MERVYAERKKKNINMPMLHDIALGLNSWNVSAKIFKFVDQENSNETASESSGGSIFKHFILCGLGCFLI